ncbi:MAG: rod-binding protein [Bdellovibrionales bacterium]
MKIQNGFSLKPTSPEAQAAMQDQRLRQAAKMYENHFLNEMVKSMRKTVDREGGMIKPSFAENIFTEQLDQQYVQGWTDRGGVGLADVIYNQIRERYDSATKKDFGHPPGPLPIAPRQEAHGLQSPDSLRMKVLPSGPDAKLNYRFEVPDPSGAGYEAQAPWSGTLMESPLRLADGWNVVRLDHGRGLTSEVTFPGAVAEFGAGETVEAGRKLGRLDSQRPVLAWKLDWTG